MMMVILDLLIAFLMDIIIYNISVITSDCWKLEAIALCYFQREGSAQHMLKIDLRQLSENPFHTTINNAAVLAI